MSLHADLQWRGLVHQATDPSIAAQLDAGGMTAYIGFDPTADSLHAGNLLQLITLARLQRGGHTPIVLAGGATGMIGDPGGKTSERQLLDVDTLRHNVAAIEPQLQHFVEFTGERPAILVNNHDWTQPISVLDFLRDVGKHFTVNQMIARESVRARLEDREQGISYTEFSYGLLQAYDFWHLFRTYHCTLQVGGSDQWGNIVGGVDYIRRREGATAFGLCTPLVTKADGTKFGKSESGAVWLDTAKTSPYAFYQFFLRVEDVMVVQYLKFFTFLSHDEIDALDHAHQERPRERAAHQALASALVKLVHGDKALDRAQSASKLLFQGAVDQMDEQMLLDVLADVPSITVSRNDLGVLPVVDALVRAGLSASKSIARQAIEQGGVMVNGAKIDTVDTMLDEAHLLHDAYAVLRRGKREYGLIRFA